MNTIPTIADTAMRALREGKITRDQAKWLIVDWKMYSSVSTGSEYSAPWGKAASQLEKFIGSK